MLFRSIQMGLGGPGLGLLVAAGQRGGAYRRRLRGTVAVSAGGQAAVGWISTVQPLFLSDGRGGMVVGTSCSADSHFGLLLVGGGAKVTL